MVQRGIGLAVLALVVAWQPERPAIAQQDGGHEIVLDPVLRHIGNARFGNQCGFHELNRIGLWGDRYTVDFRISEPGRIRIKLEQAPLRPDDKG